MPHAAHLRLDRLLPASPLFLILTSRPPPPLPCSSFPPSPAPPATRPPPLPHPYLFFDPIALLPSPQPPVSGVRPPSVPQVRSPLGKWAAAEAQGGGGEGGDRFTPCAYKQDRYMGWERGRRKKAKGGRVQETLRREYGTSKDALFQNNTKSQQLERILCVWLSNSCCRSESRIDQFLTGISERLPIGQLRI